MTGKPCRAIWLLASLMGVWLLGIMPLTSAASSEVTETTAPQATPTWLEPRGLSVLELVGFVDEAYLRGMIIYDRPGYGILRYEAGKRMGNTVTLTATAYTRYDRSWDGTLFGCLGVPPRLDQWPTVVPQTKLRIYTSSGVDITGKTVPHFYVPAGLTQPLRGPDDQSEPNKPTRYDRLGAGAPLTRDAQGNLIVPANMGCDLMIPDGTISNNHEYKTLTLVFTAEMEPHITVQVLGTQVMNFKSYIGPGYFGKFEKLAQQMRNTYPGRHDKIAMTIPAETNYIIINFPATPVDLYANLGDPSNNDNVAYPSGGTYRISFWDNNQEYLSVDFVASMGIPIAGSWIDADQSGNVPYLIYKRQPVAAAAPEYLVPAGVSYNACMLSGTCSSSILSQIYNTSMTMRVIYLKVTRTDCDLQRIPLRMVGNAWVPGMLAQTPAATAFPDTSPVRTSSALVRASIYASDTLTRMTYLPLVLNRLCASPPPDDPEGCPCGWFDSNGRMLGFIP